MTTILSETKACPYCAEEIKMQAIVCPHCGCKFQNNKAGLFFRQYRMATSVAIAIIVLCLLVIIGVSPFLTIQQLKNALREKDTEELTELVNFPAIREGLKADFLAWKKGQESDQQLGFVLLGAAVANVAIDNFVSPSGLAGLLSGRSPQEIAQSTLNRNDQEQKPNETSQSTEILNTYTWHYESFDKFVVEILSQQPEKFVYQTLNNGNTRIYSVPLYASSIRLTLRRRGLFSWWVTRIRVSANLQKTDFNKVYVLDLIDLLPAKQTGLATGDQIISIDNELITSDEKARQLIRIRKNRQIALEIERAGKCLKFAPVVNSDGVIGITMTEKLPAVLNRNTLASTDPDMLTKWCFGYKSYKEKQAMAHAYGCGKVFNIGCGSKVLFLKSQSFESATKHQSVVLSQAAIADCVVSLKQAKPIIWLYESDLKPYIDNKSEISNSHVPTISQELLFNLPENMEYPQIERLFGRQGELIAESKFRATKAKSYKWSNSDGSLAICYFENGRLMTNRSYGFLLPRKGEISRATLATIKIQNTAADLLKDIRKAERIAHDFHLNLSIVSSPTSFKGQQSYVIQAKDKTIEQVVLPDGVKLTGNATFGDNGLPIKQESFVITSGQQNIFVDVACNGTVTLH